MNPLIAAVGLIAILLLWNNEEEEEHKKKNALPKNGRNRRSRRALSGLDSTGSKRDRAGLEVEELPEGLDEPTEEITLPD